MHKPILFIFIFFLFNNIIGQPFDYVWTNPKPQGNNLNGTFFIDSLKGWCVGNVGTVLKTTDGGYSWEV